MIVYCILSAIIIIQDIIHRAERRDMLNRLMAKDLADLRQDVVTPPKHIPSAHDRVLNNWRKKKVGDE